MPAVVGSSERARIAALSRFHPDHPAVAVARREYRLLRARASIAEIAADPDLTAADRAALAAELTTSSAGSAA